MDANRLSTKYLNGVDEFIKFVVEHANNSNRIKCLWIRCRCLDKVMAEVLRDHLFIYEIDKDYTIWI